MVFPSFGDAAAYSQVGAACAAALASDEGRVFDACYHSHRPIGMVAWSAVPHLLARDPVDVAYLTLTLNVLLVCGVYLAFRRVLALDAALESQWQALSRGAAAAIVFVIVLLNLVPHVPVTLSDLPSLMAFLAAILACARILMAPTPAARSRRYLAAGLLVAVAALVRQHYVAYGLFLLAVTLALERPAPRRLRIRGAAAFLAGLSPVVLQVAAVYAHSGELWLWETATLAETFGRPNKHLIVEALFFSRPHEGGFMVKLTEPVHPVSLIVLRLFSGLFKFQWAVYQGWVSPSREWWTPSPFEMARAYAAVAGLSAMAAITILRGPLALRFLDALAVPIALSIPFVGVGHTEVRYYVFPRIVFAITLLYWMARAAARARPGRREAVEVRPGVSPAA